MAVNSLITFPGQQCGCSAGGGHFDVNGSATMALIGGRCAHPSSWNCTPEMLKAIHALAANYYAQNNFRLPVNDVALPWGGMFDIGPGLCAGETSYNPFWEAGGHFGHRLGTEVDISIDPDPPNYPFERILAAQGWWIQNPIFWKSEKTHYHLNLSVSGRVTVEPVDINALVQQSWNPQTHILGLSVTSENRGGLDANGADVVAMSASGGVTFRGLSLPLNLGEMAIRQARSFNFEAIVPPNLKAFTLKWSVAATSTASSGQVFVSRAAKSIRVPTSSLLQPGNGFLLRKGPMFEVGDWAIELFPTNQPAATDTNLVFYATIRNNTGSELFVADQVLWFQTSALPGSYELDWAPEFFDTGGLIESEGYSGPLLVLKWLSSPPPGTVSSGEIELITDGLVPHSSLRASFTSGSSPLQLAISHSTNTVTVSWPLISESVWLESSDSLNATEWVLVQESISTANGTNSVTFPIGTSSEFFRLNAAW